MESLYILCIAGIVALTTLNEMYPEQDHPLIGLINPVAYPWTKKRSEQDIKELRYNSKTLCQTLLDDIHTIDKEKYLNSIKKTYPEFNYYMGPILAYPKEYSEETKAKAALGEQKVTSACLALLWLLKKDYDGFIGLHRASSSISQDSFDQLSHMCEQALEHNPQRLESLLIRLIISQLRQVEDFRSYVKAQAREEFPQSDTLCMAIKAIPRVLPSYQMLDENTQSDLELELNSVLSVEKFLSSWMLPDELKEMQRFAQGDSKRFNLFLLGSVIQTIANSDELFYPRGNGFSDLSYRAILCVVKALEHFQHKQWTRGQVYFKYLDSMCTELNLDSNDDAKYALVRFACLMGVVDSLDISILTSAFSSLLDEDKRILIREMKQVDLKDGWVIKPLGWQQFYRSIYQTKDYKRIRLALQIGSHILKSARFYLKSQVGSGIYKLWCKQFLNSNKNLDILHNLEPRIDNKGRYAVVEVGQSNQIDSSQ